MLKGANHVLCVCLPSGTNAKNNFPSSPFLLKWLTDVFFRLNSCCLLQHSKRVLRAPPEPLRLAVWYFKTINFLQQSRMSCNTSTVPIAVIFTPLKWYIYLYIYILYIYGSPPPRGPTFFNFIRYLQYLRLLL